MRTAINDLSYVEWRIVALLFRPEDWMYRVWYISEIAEELHMPPATVRYHMRKITRHGAVYRVEAYPVYYRPVPSRWEQVMCHLEAMNRELLGTAVAHPVGVGDSEGRAA